MANTPEFIQTTVISTRIRLARNFAGFPFPSKMSDAHALDIVQLVAEGLKRLDPYEYKRYDIAKLSDSEAQLLQEQYLISPALLKRLNGGAAFVSSDRAVSIMVNEEDHLREQYIVKGFDLYKAYERLSALDDGLSSIFDFAFDEKLGYLTACPSNLGTGMRASVMMLLPGLVRNGELKAIVSELKSNGMTIRGAFGEGTSAEGYLYQVSNERTLGLSEQEILEKVSGTTMRLCNRELLAREELLRTSETETRDRCLRAYGTLSNCAILSLQEFLSKIADVKLGVLFGFLKADNQKKFDEFLDDMRPAAFRLINNLEGESERFCDEVRAETVGNVLPKLVYVTGRGSEKSEKRKK